MEYISLELRFKLFIDGSIKGYACDMQGVQR